MSRPRNGCVHDVSIRNEPTPVMGRKDLISSYGANLIVEQCVLDDNPQFCSVVHRDSAGSLWFSRTGYVDDPLLNLGYEKTAGADVSLVRAAREIHSARRAGVAGACQGREARRLRSSGG